MKILVFDTETTGLPSALADLKNQPYICQFAGLLLECDSKTNNWRELKRYEQLIKPPVPITAECSAIHGITEELVAGQPQIAMVIEDIIGLFQEAYIAVAHNLSFDQQLIEFELARLGRSKLFLPRQTFDTMKETRNLCRLPGRGGNAFKSPKLQELYKFLFNREFKNAHRAMTDVLATAICLKELYDRGIFKPQEPDQVPLF